LTEMVMKRLHIFLIVLCLAILATVFRSHLRRALVPAIQTLRGKKTVSDHLSEYGQTVRQRLHPYFQAVKMSYPPGRIVLVGLKQEKRLEVWACGSDGQFKFIRAYPILAVSGRLGPKLREGDCQVPEGLYRIESLNPNSMFHLSLRIDYPNDFDRNQAKRDGRVNLGGDIMIHGGSTSIGCLAMGDEAAEDLFVLAAQTGIENVSVILSPVDFRVTDLPELTYALPHWADILYSEIEHELLRLRTK
jgi:murein L,D-transpeptidase YafK